VIGSSSSVGASGARKLGRVRPARRPSVMVVLVSVATLTGAGSVIFAVSTPISHLLPFHTLAILIAGLALVTTAGLFVAITRQDLFISRLVELLPTLRTPESVARHLKQVLRDDSAELLFRDASSGSNWIDVHGRHRPADQELVADRFHEWIVAGDGERIGLPSGDPLFANDTVTLASLRRVVSILAENTRLRAVLRMLLAQVAAIQTARELALEHAREAFYRDLHDGLQQTLATARMDLEGLTDAQQPTERDELIEGLGAKLHLALEQVHSLKKGARPPELRFGLKPAIDRTAAELRLHARCRVAEHDLGILTLPIYYLVRESLTNVHKHAHATLAEIDITSDGRTVEVAVRDNGVGGATDRDLGGIRGMRRRVEELGGSLTVSSPPGVGTTMKASVPCVSS
jgi:signal transduction histidine kinase